MNLENRSTAFPKPSEPDRNYTDVYILPVREDLGCQIK